MYLDIRKLLTSRAISYILKSMGIRLLVRCPFFFSANKILHKIVVDFIVLICYSTYIDRGALDKEYALCKPLTRGCCKAERYRRRGETWRSLFRQSEIRFTVLSLFLRRAICALSITRSIGSRVLRLFCFSAGEILSQAAP